MADNNIDPEEIRRLSESIRELTDSTTGLDSGFGKFNTTTDTTKSTVAKLNKELDKLLKKTTELNTTTSAAKKTSDNATRGFGAVSDSSKSLGKDFKSLSKATQGLITQFNELGKTLSKLTKVKVAGTGEAGGTFKQSEYEIRLQSLGKKIDTYGNIVNILSKEQKENLKLIEKENKRKAVEDKKEDLRDRMKEESGNVLKELTDKYKTGGSFLADLNNKVFDLIGKSATLSAGWILLTAVGTGLYNATAKMTKEVYNGARGAAVSARAVKEFTDELGTATQAIGIAMMLIPGMGALRWVLRGFGAALAIGGTAIKKAGEANEVAAIQSDKLFKSFNDLSRSGILLSGGMSDVFEQMQTLGMTVAEIEEFNRILAQSAKDLKYFGATTSEGARQYIRVAGELFKSGAGKELEALGIVANEQRELTLKYMAQETRLGMSRLKTESQLIKGSEAYIKELVLLQELTGATRKEQEEAREAIMAVDELRASILEAEARGAPQAELERLRQYYEAAVSMQAMGQSQLAKGIAQYGAGGPASAEAAAVLQSMPRLIQGLESGQKANQLLGSIAVDLREALLRVAPTVRFGGSEAVQGIIPGKFAGLLDTQQKLNSNLVEGLDLQQAVARRLAEMAQRGDKDTENMIDAGRKQQGAAMLMDGVVKAFNISTNIHKGATDTFKKAVDEFSKAVGGKRPSVPSVEAPAAPAAPGQVDKILSFGGASGSRTNFDNLNPAFKEKVVSAATDYFALTGKKVQVNSSFRDSEKQRQLYADYLARGKTGMPVAPPGSSKHEMGKAIDVQNYTDPKLVTAFNAQGLKQTVPRDPVHFEEARYGGVFSGPNSGYPVMLHKNEVATSAASYQALLSDAANSLTNYRNEVSKQPISSINPLSSQPNAGKLLADLISMTDDNSRLMLNELYKSRLLQEEMLVALRTN
jgi:ABC-type transporter Mla subunit MlaD